MKAADVRRRLTDLGVRASKGLGQHFLLDEAVAHRHVEYAGIAAGDVVLEIGPGLGILTQELLRKGAKVVAVERDQRLARGLRAMGGDLDIVEGDAVEVPLPPFDRVVSNLPYQISSPITFRLLELPFERAVLMYQEEFARRLVARRGEEDYSRLSVKAFVRASTEVVERVPRSAFWPQPKVDSAIVLLEPRSAPFSVSDWDVFDAVVDVAFGHRRKTIENALMLSWERFSASRDALQRRLEGSPYVRKRPEELAPHEFGNLADALVDGGRSADS